jgi:hypothetical protein
MSVLLADHSIPLASIHATHLKHIKSVFLLFKIITPTEYLLGNRLVIDDLTEINSFIQIWGLACGAVMMTVLSIVLTFHDLVKFDSFCDASHRRWLSTSIGVVHIRLHLIDELLSGNFRGDFIIPLEFALVNLLIEFFMFNEFVCSPLSVKLIQLLWRYRLLLNDSVY